MTPEAVLAGSVRAGRSTVHWAYAPGDDPFWAGVSPTQGIPALTAALSTSDTDVEVTVRATEPYTAHAGTATPDPDGPWACYTESGPARRISWPARVESGTAGLLETTGDTAVAVSANNEPFRRKLFRTSLLTPLLLAGGVALVHAVAVARDGVTVLLVGGSGSGKSTLGLAATTAGWRVVAEDTVFVSADLAVVPLFLSGAWECRVRGADRDTIRAVTGASLDSPASALPLDHRGRGYLFTHPGDGPDRPVRIDLVVFVRRGDADTTEERLGNVLGAGPGTTLGAVARLLRLDVGGIVDQTATITRAVVGDLPSQVFRATGDLAGDLRNFLSCLEKWTGRVSV